MAAANYKRRASTCPATRFRVRRLLGLTTLNASKSDIELSSSRGAVSCRDSSQAEIPAAAEPRRACMGGTWPALKYVTRREARDLGHPETYATAEPRRGEGGTIRLAKEAVYTDLVFRGRVDDDAFAHVVDFADCAAWKRLNELVTTNKHGKDLRQALPELGSGYVDAPPEDYRKGVQRVLDALVYDDGFGVALVETRAWSTSWHASTRLGTSDSTSSASRPAASKATTSPATASARQTAPGS